MPCFFPLHGFKDVNGGLTFKKTHIKLQVACGQCLGCRLERTLVWGMRIVHEAHLHENNHGNCFVTLTYRSRDECTPKQLRDGHYVPKDYSLNKAHFQKFIKRLRKHFPQKIKYFHCGEYGEEGRRPHYHACMFNCSFDDLEHFKECEGINTYTSANLARLWQYGFCTVGELNFATASYTAGYILKKITGKKAEDEYLRNDEYGVAFWVLAPYITMSLGRKAPGGIGADFYEKYKSDFFPSDESPVPGKGIIRKVPRYYQNLYADMSPEGMEKIKAVRQAFREAHAADYTPERMMDKFTCAKARIAQQTRKTL